MRKAKEENMRVNQNLCCIHLYATLTMPDYYTHNDDMLTNLTGISLMTQNVDFCWSETYQ